MNQVFFSETQNVQVSRITTDGWWLENTTEHVVKGTALGKDFTVNIYTPSQDGMISRYDRETDTWSDEIKDRTYDVYFNQYGQKFVIGEPDGDYPEWAIVEAPPEYNQETQTVWFKDEQWQIYPIQIGEHFYDDEGRQLTVSDYNFELPNDCTWTPKPEVKEGYDYKLVDHEWVQLEDHIDEVVWSKETGMPFIIEELGAIDDKYTTLEFISYSTWDEIKSQWVVTEASAQQQRQDILTASIAAIDDTSEMVINKWTRFTTEYEESEKAAIEYKAAGYEGDVSIFITSYADAAGVSYQEATDTILIQADGLRNLQAQLRAQRMRKYELKQPDLTLEQITTLRDEIITNIQTLGASHD